MTEHSYAFCWKLLLILLPVLLAGAGCQGYSRSVTFVRTSMARGDTDQALAHINQKLGASDASETPSSLSGDQVLYLMERALVLQSLEDYKRSSRDLMLSDNRLEYLDITSSSSLELGKYLYSERATTYRAPAYERLLLNSLNMINFLARNEYQKARVEARRFAIIEDFFVKQDEQVIHKKIHALGNYLGGISFERGGNFSEAARYYGRAYYFGLQTEKLKNRVTDLFQISGYTPGELRANDPDALREITDAADRSSTSVDEYREKYLSGGDTLIVLQTGMVPYRDEEQVEVNRAITIARGSSYSRHRLSSSQVSRFRTVSARAGFRSVPFLALTQGSVPRTRSTKLTVTSRSETQLQPLPVVDVGRQAETYWEQRRGALMVAAITRFLTRMVAAGVASQQVRRSTGSSGAGLLAGIATYLVLKGLDQPDTRSWITLPGEIQLFRGKLENGSASITVNVGPRSEQKEVTVSDSELNLFNFSRLR